MDEIQKALIKAGRKDLAQKYYEKTAAGIEGDKISFDNIDASIEIVDAPVGDSAFKIVFKTHVSKNREYLVHYPEDVNLGKTHDFRTKMKKEIAKSLVKLANGFDNDLGKLIDKYDLIRIKSSN